MAMLKTVREMREREVTYAHVPSKSLTPWGRRLVMELPLYSCSCGEWQSEDFPGFRDHFDAELSKLN